MGGTSMTRSPCRRSCHPGVYSVSLFGATIALSAGVASSRHVPARQIDAVNKDEDESDGLRGGNEIGLGGRRQLGKIISVFHNDWFYYVER